MDIIHFNQPQKRDATFIKPPNTIKLKVGSGGLDESALNRAQKIIETCDADFIPVGRAYLNSMMKGIEKAKASLNDDDADIELIIGGMLFPSAQLKANGGMFNFPLVTRLADRFVQFLEVVDTIDGDVIEISLAFHKIISLVLDSKIKGDAASNYSENLVNELNLACMRYFEKHSKQDPAAKSPEPVIAGLLE